MIGIKCERNEWILTEMTLEIMAQGNPGLIFTLIHNSFLICISQDFLLPIIIFITNITSLFKMKTSCH